jgi:hypothetical protein
MYYTYRATQTSHDDGERYDQNNGLTRLVHKCDERTSHMLRYFNNHYYFRIANEKGELFH